MKRILFLSSIDLNRRDGGALATLGYYNALCKLFPGLVDIAMPEEDCRDKFSTAIAIPKRNLKDFFLGSFVHRGYSFIKEYVNKHKGKYSVCVVNISRTAGDLINEFRKVGMKTIVIHHNYEVEFTMSNKHPHTLYGLFPYFVSKIEGSAYKNADINCFLTEPDMKSISNAYGTTKAVNVVTGVFESEMCEHRPSTSLDINTMVLTGSMCDYQTYRSAEIFENEYFDMLLKILPNVNLIIAGRNPHKSIWNFENHYPNNITVVANPNNIDEVIDKATIFLCPTCYGSGIKLRVMDGLRKGLPVIVHEISARGYEYFFNKPYFQVYDDINSFSQGLNNIISYIKGNENYKHQIISDYSENFSFNGGVKKISKIMSLLDIKI